MSICTVCKREFSPADEGSSLYGDAGNWLASEIDGEEGPVCLACRESRALLTMMYVRDMRE